jgi:hypothetical protein
MTFATPLLAGIAAAIAIPALIILYFLKLRRRDVEISTTLLWKKAIQDLQANAPFQKLRRNLLLFLQIIVLGIILLALAQPEVKHTTLSQQRQVILIDRSASMQATDGEGNPAAEAAASSAAVAPGLSRLEAAKKRALAMVDQMKEPGLFQERADEAMVIAFDSTAEVRQAFTSNKAELRRAIEAITATDAPSSLERAFTLAKAYGGTQKFEDQVQGRDTTEPGRGFVPSSPPATIHLFSDGRLPDSDRVQTDRDDNVVYHAVGTRDAANIGITSLRAQRAFDDPGKVSIFVGLQSTARTERRVQIELLIDDTVVRVSNLTLPAATKAIQNEGEADAENLEEIWTPAIGGNVYQVERAEGAIARVRITPVGDDVTDALAADNLAFLVIPPARRLAVALVTQGNFFVKDVLDGMNLSKLDVLTIAEFQKLLDGNQLAQYDVFIFDRVLPEVKITAPPAAPPLSPPPPRRSRPAAAPAFHPADRWCLGPCRRRRWARPMTVPASPRCLPPATATTRPSRWRASTRSTSPRPARCAFCPTHRCATSRHSSTARPAFSRSPTRRRWPSSCRLMSPTPTGRSTPAGCCSWSTPRSTSPMPTSAAWPAPPAARRSSAIRCAAATRSPPACPPARPMSASPCPMPSDSRSNQAPTAASRSAPSPPAASTPCRGAANRPRAMSRSMAASAAPSRPIS